MPGTYLDLPGEVDQCCLSRRSRQPSHMEHVPDGEIRAGQTERIPHG